MKKKITILVILVSLAATLITGCSGSTITVTTSNGLTTVTRLALGTLKLENTVNAVTSEQAIQLLTLWQGYLSLSNSDTSAQVELDALVKQIEGVMTDAQLMAIDSLNLTNQSVTETLNTLGANVSSNISSGTPNASALSQSGPSSASSDMPSGAPGEVPPSGSGGMGPAGDSSGLNGILNGTSAQATPSGTQSSTVTAVRQVNPILLQAVIQLLETRSTSTG
jgi:hypothetical protein